MIVEILTGFTIGLAFSGLCNLMYGFKSKVLKIILAALATFAVYVFFGWIGCIIVAVVGGGIGIIRMVRAGSEVGKKKNEEKADNPMLTHPQPAEPAMTTGNIFCTNCGKPLSAGSRFCDKCGSPVT